MRVTLKLFAALAPHLPEGAVDNAVEIEVAEGTTVFEVFDRFRVPREKAHLVLVNGLFVAPDARAARALEDGDALAAWPPVAGG